MPAVGLEPTTFVSIYAPFQPFVACFVSCFQKILPCFQGNGPEIYIFHALILLERCYSICGIGTQLPVNSKLFPVLPFVFPGIKDSLDRLNLRVLCSYKELLQYYRACARYF